MGRHDKQRAPILEETADLAQNMASCVISDVGYGSEDIASRIRYVRIAEPIGWPYDNKLGGQRYGEKGPKLINWTPIRILGDVPVLPDGSAHFQVPPDTAVYFQLLDENRMELRRMRSFISFQPGERRACAGCHESRGMVPRPGNASLAANLPPQPMIPPPWGDRPVSFLRDIQPIFDRHCVACHSGLKPAGELDFFCGLTDWSRQFEKTWGLVPGYGFNRAFETITRAQLVATTNPNLQDSSITLSLAYGAHRSKLLKVLNSAPHTQRAILNTEEKLRLVMWMDSNAPYHDQFVNKRADHPAYDLASDQDLAKNIASVHERRCIACHQSAAITRLDWIDPRQPERSLFLTAPLLKDVAKQKCKGAVYQNTQDADYQAVKSLVETAVNKAQMYPRRDLHTQISAGINVH
jgi:mono/diheme cytochrome c family protein